MSQYRNRDWYIGRFKGGENGIRRPPRTMDEAYALITENLKRPGSAGEAHCAKAAYKEFYKEDFMSPEERIIRAKEAKLAELDRQIKEKEALSAKVENLIVSEPTPNVADENEVLFSKEEFKAKYIADNGADNPLVRGRAWKKYCKDNGIVEE